MVSVDVKHHVYLLDPWTYINYVKPWLNLCSCDVGTTPSTSWDLAPGQYLPRDDPASHTCVTTSHFWHTLASLSICSVLLYVRGNHKHD